MPVLIDSAITQNHQPDILRATPMRHAERVNSVLSLMPPEEKVGHLNLLSSGFAETGPVLNEQKFPLTEN